jgi:hypothetical protein
MTDSEKTKETLSRQSPMPSWLEPGIEGTESFASTQSSTPRNGFNVWEWCMDVLSSIVH